MEEVVVGGALASARTLQITACEIFGREPPPESSTAIFENNQRKSKRKPRSPAVAKNAWILLS
jgi:hypothetical protein